MVIRTNKQTNNYHYNTGLFSEKSLIVLLDSDRTGPGTGGQHGLNIADQINDPVKTEWVSCLEENWEPIMAMKSFIRKREIS